MSPSATLTVILAPPKAAKKEAAEKPADAGTTAPVKRVRAKAAPPPLPLVFELRRAGADVVLGNPGGWVYELSPKALVHYETDWENILGIRDRVDVASAVLVVGDRTLLDVKKIGSHLLPKMLQLFSLLHCDNVEA
jgi:hypothetical protein